MAAVYFRLHRPKVSKNGLLKETPVSIRVQLYINQQVKPEIATGEKVIPKLWNGVNEVSSKVSGHIEINRHLKKIKEDLLNLWRDNKDDLSKINESLLRSVVVGKNSEPQKKTLFEALLKFKASHGKNKEDKSKARYDLLEKRLTEFNDIHPIDLHSFGLSDFHSFKEYLYGIPNPNYKGSSLHYDPSRDCYVIRPDSLGDPVGLFDGAVCTVLSTLRTFFIWADKFGYQVNTSFKQWELNYLQPEPISLTMEELEAIESVQLKKKTQDIARDIFVFECRTCQRISDIKAFSLADLNLLNETWTFSPRKGRRLRNKKVTVFFKGEKNYCRPALDILVKYNFNIPTRGQYYLNQNIRKVCEAAKINTLTQVYVYANDKRILFEGPKHEFITSHVGRKTFITLALSMGMPPVMVAELAGNTEKVLLKHYKAKSESAVVEQYLSGLGESISVMKKSS